MIKISKSCIIENSDTGSSGLVGLFSVVHFTQHRIAISHDERSLKLLLSETRQNSPLENFT